MNKIKSIIQGWKNDWLYNRGKIPEPIKELFDDRLKVCRSNECGQLIGFVCGACGCPIKKKAKSLMEQCPENMWNPVIWDSLDETRPDDKFIVLSDVPELLRPQLKSFLVKTWHNECSEDIYALVVGSLRNPDAFIYLRYWNAFLEELEKSI